ncbi:MAG: uracil-DNA glycosylase [Victivallales bacterium]|nr:uracil-DNA glycosylase [Victivallales bacterium]
MGTIFQELQRILSLQKARGIDSAWISPENLKAFYQPTFLSRQPAAHVAVPSALPNAQPPVQKPLQPKAVSQAAYQTRFQGLDMNSTTRQEPTLSPMPDVSSADWDVLKETALACHACRLYAGRRNMVFEDGCRQARVMFIGEGPGEDEDKQGVPFVGRAGQLLTRMILAMGLDRNSQDPAKAAYIANIVKCRPPGNRNPAPDEGSVCIAYLKRQIQLVNPEVIVLLGNVPLSFLLGKSGITRLRGQWLNYGAIPVMPTFHPAYILRFESNRVKFIEEKRKVWVDLQQVMAKLGLPLPK